MTIKAAAAGLLLAAGVAGSASAQPKEIRLGFIGPFSGPTGTVGEQTYQGVMFALSQLGNKLGGVPVTVLRQDDAGKPDIGLQIVNQMIERDKVDVLIGPLLSNVLLASYKTIIAAHVPVISPVAGPSQIAGRECSPYFFNTSWQNDQPSAAMGRYLQDKGVKNLVIVAPNFPGGHDAIAGFKSQYKGNVAKEFWTGMQEMDFAPVLAELRALKPEGVFLFMPGSAGINFIRQYAQAGLGATIPMYSASTIDGISIGAIGAAAMGSFQTASYNYDIDNAANTPFRANFKAQGNGEPNFYTAYAYDAVNLLNAGVTALHGDVSDRPALAHALETAKFASVRGSFRFNTNHFPVQDFYLLQVVAGPADKATQALRGTVLHDFTDSYVADCHMEQP